MLKDEFLRYVKYVIYKDEIELSVLLRDSFQDQLLREKMSAAVCKGRCHLRGNCRNIRP